MDPARERLTRAGLFAAFALLYAGAFPFRAGALRFDAGLVLGWVALIPLALGLRGLSPGRAFLFTTAAGTAAFAGIHFWIYVVVEHFGGAHPLAAVAAVGAMAAVLGAHLGAAGALAAWLEPRAGRFAWAMLPAAWVCLEWVRSFAVFGGFPWSFLGHSAHANGPLRALAALGGVYGLSALLAVFAALASRRRFGVALSLLAAAHLLGFALGLGTVPDAAAGAGDAPRVAIVQGNVPQGVKWDPARVKRSFRMHVEKSREVAAAADLELIVWPEAAVTGLLEHDEALRSGLADLARETGASLVVGGLAVEPHAGGYRYFNSVYALAPDGRYVDRYDKAHLVPFGEYLPLRGLLGHFVSALATGAASTDITPGPGPRPLAPLPGFGADHALSALICYEVIYPGLVREAVQRGARVLVNVTNDAWYGRTSGPHQFMAIAALRSAEHGVPMVRAANTGVSAIVDAGGGVRRATPLFERWAIAEPLPAARPGATLYSVLGDWVVWISIAIVIAVGGISRVRGHRHPGDPRGAPDAR